jgi:soluble lytic murein transglycosylase-like protein
MRTRHVALALVSAAAVAGCGDGGAQHATAPPAAGPPATPTPAPLPAADGPLPRDADALAAQLADVRPRLRAAARAWNGSGAVPEVLTLLALREQRLVLRLADRRSLIGPVLARLPDAEHSGVRDEVRAQRELDQLAAGWPVRRRFRTGAPEPARRLWRIYGLAQRRFGVPRPLLAAVNLVESQFGRMRNDSVAGAQGPMQFMPATWAAYGLGGDVHDPRDAILGAANYLRANGAPRDVAQALYRYNPSPRYVEAVRRYARRMRDAPAFRAFYARQVFVRAPGGGRRRITGP